MTGAAKRNRLKFNKMATTSIGLIMAALLSACSGSGGGSSPPPEATTPPTSTNASPSLGGDVTVTVDENSAEVTTVSATDSDGDTITYAIAGEDAGEFLIDSSSGDLVFNIAPDFENPRDMGTDNTYELEVTASDSFGGSDTAAITVTINNLAETRYLEQLFAETEITDDIIYATVGGQALALNVVTPVGDTEANRPFILFATGGGFAVTFPALSIPFAEGYARAGYVAAVMDYRVTGNQDMTPEEAQIATVNATHDMVAAVRFMRANADAYGINPDQIIVSGTSAGAFMAATLATRDPDDPLPPTIQTYVDANGGVYGTVGDHVDQSPAVQGALTYSGNIFDLDSIDLNSAPVYGAHEELDPVAPCGTTTSTDGITTLHGTCDFIPAMQVLGLPAQSFIVPDDDGHVDFSNEEYAQIRNESLAFFKTHVIDAE
ncbi:MAG: carboxylesterase family protein [Pseudomonadota bacterium]